MTLEGTLDAFWKKARTQDLVYRMRGVSGLTNKVAVAPTQAYEDEQLAREIINALDRNIIVNVDEINVSVEQGIVYLTGTVTSWAAKRAAYDAARYTQGVKEVVNQILVG